MVGRLTFSDQNWCLSEHVTFWSDTLSDHDILTIGRKFLQDIRLDSAPRQKNKYVQMSDQICFCTDIMS